MQISSRVKDLRGRKFGRLKVMSFVGLELRMAMWKCVCKCGKEIVTRGSSLRSGHTVSCGCVKWEHGLGASKTYCSWMEMKRRCLDPFHRHYDNYGARGIKICKRWMKFLNFLE